jgi:hypothetical protein
VKRLRKARTALSMYETAIVSVADGDAVVINKAGLLSRDEAPAAPIPLARVAKVNCELGRNASESKLSWPETPGAASYAVEVNLTPQTPAGPWTALGTVTRRTKVVKAPAPGAQFLARIAAVASDGTPSDWSDTVLATAR